MLKLSSGSCMLRLGLRLSIGSCMLRLGLRLRLSFRGSGELSLSMPEPMLSLSMLILATHLEAALDVTLRTHGQN